MEALTTLRAADLAPFLRDPPQDPDAVVARIEAIPSSGSFRARRIEILPGTVGGELRRTRGHHRSLCEAAAMTWPAVLRVLSGEGAVLLQRASLSPEAVTDFLVAPVASGQTALLLPDFAQVVVNTGSAPLSVEVWEAAACLHEHAPIRAFQGPAWYPLAKDGEMSLVPNVRYAELPSPRWVQPKEASALGFRFGETAPFTEKAHPWLVHPEDAFEDYGQAYEYFEAR